jgi:hypothetical protein
MSSLEQETSLKAFQCCLKWLNSSSKALRDGINDNRLVQEVAIEGLQSNLTRDVKAQEVGSIKELKSNSTKDAKVKQVNIVQLQSNFIKITKFLEVGTKELPSNLTKDVKMQEISIRGLQLDLISKA